MIDIHTHVLPFVDDGSDSFETSFLMLENAVNQGITQMILTPHFSEREYEPEKNQLIKEFEDFKVKVKERGLSIALFLGQEIFIRKGYKKLFENQQVLTMSNTPFVLIEFDTRLDFDISEAVYDLKRMGYQPIVAHFERYSYADISVAEEIKSVGGYIQVNAGSIVGKNKRTYFKKVKELIKEGLVDFVASDIHDFRDNQMKKAFEFVEKRFGEQTARKLFIENAKKIIEG